MAWLYYSLASVALLTILSLLQRVISVESKNPRAFAVVFNVLGGVFSLLIIILTSGLKTISFNVSETALLLALGGIVLYTGSERLRFYAAKYLEASVLITVTTIATLIAFGGAVFLYDEPLTTPKVIGLVLILLAIFLVSVRKGVRYSKGIKYGIATSVFIGLAWLLDKAGATNFTAETYNLIVWAFPIPLIYLFPRIKTADIKVEIKNASWRLPLLSLINVSAYFLQLKALEIAQATKVIPIVQTSILTTVLLGILILKERKNISIKLAAGAIAFLGTYLIVQAL